jgi:hypothetical protein
MGVLFLDQLRFVGFTNRFFYTADRSFFLFSGQVFLFEHESLLLYGGSLFCQGEARVRARKRPDGYVPVPEGLTRGPHRISVTIACQDFQMRVFHACLSLNRS